MNTNIIPASPGACLSAGARFATKLGSIGASQEAVDAFIQDGNHPFYRSIAEHFAPKLSGGTPVTNPELKPADYLPTLDDCLVGWPEFCKEFGLAIDVDFEGLKADQRIAGRRSGFDWLVYCPKGLSTRQAFELCRRQFNRVWEEIPVEEYSLERNPDKTDLVLCRATVEPDEAWLKQTSDEMKATPTPFLDARERYMLEAFYYWLTKKLTGKGKHLDIVGWTRCPRSRTSDGKVARAFWDGVRFKAYWSYADHRDPKAGGREVVSL